MLNPLLMGISDSDLRKIRSHARKSLKSNPNPRETHYSLVVDLPADVMEAAVTLELRTRRLLEEVAGDDNE